MDVHQPGPLLAAQHAVPDFFAFGEGMGPIRAGEWASAMTRVNGETA